MLGTSIYEVFRIQRGEYRRCRHTTNVTGPFRSRFAFIVDVDELGIGRRWCRRRR
jgi:hypothetical protein